MLFSEIKQIRQWADDGWRDAVENIISGESDFTAGRTRFINSNDIDDIMQDELASDEYMLGCFNSWFIADVCGIDSEAVEAMQKSEAYEGLGKLIISMGKLPELQKAYASADGYGHHFNSYDFGEDEFSPKDHDNYYVFPNSN